MTLDNGAVATVPVDKRPDQSWLDYLCVLLHIGAELEHALMVQYLYAAYSLGGEQVPAEHRSLVVSWRDSILTVAREEMGHLLTVQNLLCLLGAPINFSRSDYPFDSPYYPFPFKLEPLSEDSLARYVYAEKPAPMPEGAQEHEKRVSKQVTKAVEGSVRHPHPVGMLYDRIIELIGDSTKIPDSAFCAQSYACQASWDEWGKGYRPPPSEASTVLDEERKRGKEQDRLAPGERHGNVLVERMATRTEALDALQRVAAQGEAPHLRRAKVNADGTGEPSHFERFVEVYSGFAKSRGGWSPARPNLPTNPTVLDPGMFPSSRATYIESEKSREWANLSNLRYRMLLTYLSHSFRLARDGSVQGGALRGPTLHKIFGEMYNIKTLAGLLMRMPLSDEGEAPRAGPPFGMPYTLVLPTSEADCWRLHLELLCSTQALAKDLSAKARGDERGYLAALLELDRESEAWVRHVLGGMAGGRTGA